MSSRRGTTRSDPPPADERLVAESRYEIEDGKVVYVAPADEPHASRHSKLSALLEAHVAILGSEESTNEAVRRADCKLVRTL